MYWPSTESFSPCYVFPLLPPSVDLPFKKKKQMMLDVASGMQYLHSQNPVIIHRDLKSLNVLIDEDWVTKVNEVCAHITLNISIDMDAVVDLPLWSSVVSFTQVSGVDCFPMFFL